MMYTVRTDFREILNDIGFFGTNRFTHSPLIGNIAIIIVLLILYHVCSPPSPIKKSEMIRTNGNWNIVFINYNSQCLSQ